MPAAARSGSTYYYMADGLRTIRNVIDSSEVVKNTYDYYAFGNTLTASPADVTNPYRYTGREYESGSILDTHYYRNRYYVSGLGIFASRDAMWADEARGWGYAGASPVAYVDPYGLKWCCTTWVNRWEYNGFSSVEECVRYTLPSYFGGAYDTLNSRDYNMTDDHMGMVGVGWISGVWNWQSERIIGWGTGPAMKGIGGVVTGIGDDIASRAAGIAAAGGTTTAANVSNVSRAISGAGRGIAGSGAAVAGAASAGLTVGAGGYALAGRLALLWAYRACITEVCDAGYPASETPVTFFGIELWNKCSCPDGGDLVDSPGATRPYSNPEGF